MKRNSTAIAVLVAPWLLAASLPAAAITIYSWNAGNCATGSSLQTSCTDTATVPAGGGTATYSAISDSGATVSGQRTLAAAYVGNYNPNLGVTTRAGPNNASGGTGSDETTVAPDHAIDNNGNSEFMLLSFTNAVSLRDVQLGYKDTDSDLTVLAYTGAGTPTLVGNNSTYNGLIAAGWSFIGNYSDAYDTTTTVSGFGSQANTVAINAGGVSSSYWLIGAYNSTWGTTNSGTVGSLSTGNDYVKLLAAYGCVSGPNPTQCGGSTGSQVPEPSTVLLVGAALLGLSQLRRRRTA